MSHEENIKKDHFKLIFTINENLIHIMLAEIIKYKSILNSIGDLIANSPFKMEYIIRETEIPPSTFYRKMKNATFTPDEIMKIAKILRPEEVYLFELKESIKDAKEDYKAGRVTTHKDVIEEIKKDFFLS